MPWPSCSLGFLASVKPLYPGFWGSMQIVCKPKVKWRQRNSLSGDHRLIFFKMKPNEHIGAQEGT